MTPRPETALILAATLEHSARLAIPHHDRASAWCVGPASGIDAVAASELVMLTISAHTFRALVLLHFHVGHDTLAWVAELLKLDAAKIERAQAYDYIGEFGNALCGEVKREFNKAVPYLGMSTPNRLLKKCLASLNEEAYTYDAHVQAAREGGPTFGASLYVHAYADLELGSMKIDPNEQAVQTSTLEMF